MINLARFRGLGQACSDGTDDCLDPEGGVPVLATPVQAAVPDCAFGGTWPNCNANPVSASYPNPVAAAAPVASPVATPVAQTPSGAVTAAALAPLTSAAASIIKANTTPAPYVIPGTNSIYNPATGQIGVAATSLSALSTSLTPLLLLGGVVLLVMSMSGRR